MALPGSQHQHFLLKWNNHRSNLVNVFESLLQKDHFTDVTLAVEGRFLKAHKIVLSACSPYFQSMFVQDQSIDKHPILIFHDLKFNHVKTLLEFMYRGEISIDEKDLSDILKVAETLSIRGLSSFDSDDETMDEDKQQQAPGNPQSSSGSKSGQSSHHQNHQNIQSPPSSPSNDVSNPGAGSGHGSGMNGHINSVQHQMSNLDSAITAAINGGSSPSPPPSPSSSDIVNQHHQNKKVGKKSSTSTTSGGAVDDQKVKRRGRKPIKKNIPALNEIKPSTNKLTLPVRQGVRRRLPKKFASLKRERNSNDEGDDDEFLMLPDLGGSEPLSEMSVRGLDLFKYASIDNGIYRCIECEKMRIPKTFKNKYSFQRHAFLYHEGNMRKVFPCPICSREFSRPDKMKNHLRSVHLHQGTSTPPVESPTPSTTSAIDNCDF